MIINTGRTPRLLGVSVLAMLCASLANAQNPFAVVEYGGLTFGESTPADINKVAGELKGCAKDEPHLGLKDATVCTVVISTMSSTGAYNVSQQFVFENELLREVTLTASEDGTFKALNATLSKRYARIKPPVYLPISDGRRIIITTYEGRLAAPKLLRRVEPGYSEAARKAGMEGVTILEAIVTADGNVEDVRVLKSVNLLLDASAVRAVQQWKYEPAKLDGNPIAVYLTVTTTFRLDRSPKR